MILVSMCHVDFNLDVDFNHYIDLFMMIDDQHVDLIINSILIIILNLILILILITIMSILTKLKRYDKDGSSKVSRNKTV